MRNYLYQVFVRDVREGDYEYTCSESEALYVLVELFEKSNTIKEYCIIQGDSSLDINDRPWYWGVSKNINIRDFFRK
jgi:hypothetical protein